MGIPGGAPARALSAHPSRRWLVVLALGVLVAVVGVAALLIGYDPLRPGSAFGVRPGPLVRTNERAVRIAYRDGATVTFGFSIRNDGPLGVTVTRVDLPRVSEDTVFLLEAAEVRMWSENDLAEYVYEGDHVVPFKPFSLGQGAERWIVVEARLDNCERWEREGAQVQKGVGVTYRVLGLTKRTRVAFATPLRVEAPGDVRCPERAA